MHKMHQQTIFLYKVSCFCVKNWRSATRRATSLPTWSSSRRPRPLSTRPPPLWRLDIFQHYYLIKSENNFVSKNNKNQSPELEFLSFFVVLELILMYTVFPWFLTNWGCPQAQGRKGWLQGHYREGTCQEEFPQGTIIFHFFHFESIPCMHFLMILKAFFESEAFLSEWWSNQNILWRPIYPVSPEAMGRKFAFDSDRLNFSKLCFHLKFWINWSFNICMNKSIWFSLKHEQQDMKLMALRKAALLIKSRPVQTKA